MQKIELYETRFSPAVELNAFEQCARGNGAVVSFTGLVRPGSPEDPITALYLQAYEPLTSEGIKGCAETAKERWSLGGLLILHRIGTLQPNEPIVFVAAASRHRREAFEAVDFVMDYLKTKAVFWKKETRSSGDYWIEPREADYAGAARWIKEHADAPN